MPPLTSAAFPQHVDSLLRAAFDGEDEAALVHALRADRDMAAELTVTEGDKLVGYAALSWMKRPSGWVCLAPVAVEPSRQRRGIGGKLMKSVQHWISERDLTAVVLGDPNYYGKRGFSSARAQNLISPYPIEHTLLAGPGKGAPKETLTYPSAFDA
ncbi:Acetyltransferase (GNAT) family protein [Falsiruegeria litorea R37]|uniref:Acetyltransferase (GNAT) family protein n=1 Tax=Falsiruegeria litorea R37 TaxID=1200284 RepID=A0A1Y5S2M5_9RHOB|nr:N-acetyltransferase [Falsiruegeria litorea]SLN28262.1 Acetyltransferase (GNAT) family protein [Falsiruegeria litorea R37]